MSWITFLLSILSALIQYGPEIAALVQSIIAAIEGLHPSSQLDMTAELAGAVKTYQVTGDKRPLLDLLQKIHDLVNPPPQKAA